MKDQLNLLILNSVLLIFMVWFSFRLQKGFWFKRKVSRPVQEAYDAINYALKTNVDTLELVVDQIPLRDFVPFYHGLRDHYMFKLSLQARYNRGRKPIEYITLDLTSYRGPRNKPLVPKMLEDSCSERMNSVSAVGNFQTKPFSNPVPSFPVSSGGAYQVVRSFTQKIMPFQMKKSVPADVIDLATFRAKREIRKI